MNREEFIEMLVKLARIRYNLSEVDLNEFRTVLEMMPDRESKEVQITPISKTDEQKRKPYPIQLENVPLMYGPPR